MKICITSSGNNLDSPVDSRFGRCGYFIIWDDANGSFEAIANPNIDAGSGAGIQSAQLVVNQGAAVVISSDVGPKAEAVFKTANVKIITGASGTVKGAIEKYKTTNFTIAPAQELTETNDAILNKSRGSKIGNSVRSFLGLGRGRCMGRGNGRGRGMGGGMGRKAGNGSGQGQGGNCICPKCGETLPHQRGIPCRSVNCPKCGTIMVRE